MELEEAIKILENFKNNKLERDKLEIRYHGGFKIGDIHKFTELNPAIETILNCLTKQDKMIELMLEYLNFYGVEDDICTAELSKDCNENCKECIKQYFEKKVEEN